MALKNNWIWLQSYRSQIPPMPTFLHQASWCFLLEMSGLFLSVPMALRAFPQGLDTVDANKLRTLRLAREAWRDSQSGRRPDLVLHNLWVRFVLMNLPELARDLILKSRDIPTALRAAIAGRRRPWD